MLIKDDAFSANLIDDLKHYLAIAGWRKSDVDPLRELWVPTTEYLDGLPLSNQKKEVQILLPGVKPTFDGAELYRDAIKLLGFLEKRREEEVSDDLEVGAADSVSIRLRPDTPSGQAPLGLARETIGGVHKLVLGSACRLSNTQALLPSSRPMRAERYADEVRYATEPGSFVINLALPLVDRRAPEVERDENQNELFEVGPYGRRVSNRVSEVISAAWRISSEYASNPNSVVHADQFEDFNTHELDGLSAIGGPAESSIGYSARIAQTPLSAYLRSKPQVLTFSTRQLDIIESASDLLKSEEVIEDVTLRGNVTDLHRDGAFGNGNISVSGTIEQDGYPRKYKLNLGEADYNLAYEAHGGPFEAVVRGDLIMGRRIRRFLTVHDFRIVRTDLD